jgi:hypothetical protein
VLFEYGEGHSDDRKIEDEQFGQEIMSRSRFIAR